MSLASARIAVVHDWLLDYSGAERVLAEILRCFPQARLFALLDRMAEDVRELGHAEGAPTFEGRSMTVILTPNGSRPC